MEHGGSHAAGSFSTAAKSPVLKLMRGRRVEGCVPQAALDRIVVDAITPGAVDLHCLYCFTITTDTARKCYLASGTVQAISGSAEGSCGRFEALIDEVASWLYCR